MEQTKELIIDGVRYVPDGPKEKDYEILQMGILKGINGNPDKEYIHSIKRLSDDEIFTICDLIELTWYDTFIAPHIIREFVETNNEIYARYGEGKDKSRWVICNVRKVTTEEIIKAIDNHCQKANRK